ncbi:hypothetical protein BMS3Bbin12_01611 [bacterium BMS3Bbin12]|nr:hypothetical protein BMS3Abin12_01827 [bacterium BMS3Abin12]GBE48433.1 hypothetical protein BMS3Bbin12_01611 [bacterium BMS3Bbin12]GBE50580.1 hypothetical protein BMS3Bbin13_01520 [bacterium BMS3Bbin13]
MRSGRDEKGDGGNIIYSLRPLSCFQEWSEAFPNSVLANATIDRLFEQAHTLVLKGKKLSAQGPDHNTRG